jgi:hypothetical protein
MIFGKATNKVVEMPPQILSLTFNEDGKVTKFTGGYVMDKEIGNSGGLGGIFGIKYAVGNPFPFREAKPWTPSLGFRMFNFVGSIIQKFQKQKAI